MDDATLGGRLPLLPPAARTSAQTALANRMHAKYVPWADAAGFESDTADGRLIGPFNPLLYSAAIGGGFLDLQDAESSSTSLAAAMREVVILTVGGVWQSAKSTRTARSDAKTGFPKTSSAGSAPAKHRTD